MTLLRNFLNVGALTLGSRVLGFVRDALVAAVLGTGPAADAYLAAFRFPNLFRRLFAEGAFNTAFIPLFAKSLEQEGREPARLWAARIMSWLFFVVLAVTILAEIFMPWVMAPFVPGFLDDQAKYDLTVLLTRICFPYLMFMSLMAAYAAILNGLGHFKAAAFAPILLNIVMIVFMAPLVLYPNTDVQTAIWIAVGTLAGGAAQLAMVYAAIRRAGFVPRLQWPRLDADVRRFWVLAIPAVIAGGITQVNIFVGTIIASSADSAIAYLYYADRLYQLPLGIIGIAIGTVLLPELARHLKAGRDAEADQSQSQSLLIAMFLSLPAATALMALAFPIVRVLFERGAFTAIDTAETAQTLVWFAAGLPAYVLIRVLQPGFFAREDTRTPTAFAAVS
ncbi:MAG: murein biosynthesis integral membrane protein MurJ, partial [Devosia sp.]